MAQLSSPLNSIDVFQLNQDKKKTLGKMNNL